MKVRWVGQPEQEPLGASLFSCTSAHSLVHTRQPFNCSHSLNQQTNPGSLTNTTVTHFILSRL